MPTLTAPATTLDWLRAGVDLVERIAPPEDVTVHVDHHTFKGRASVVVGMFPVTTETRRSLMQSPEFTGVAWDRGVNASSTNVGPVQIALYDADRGGAA